MKITAHVFALSVLSLLIFSSCKKGALVDVTETTTPTTTVNPVDTAQVVAVPTSFKRTVPLGTGSGALTIDGATLGLQCNDLIKIKGGTYTSITIKDILSKDGCPITIKNDGLVQILGQNTMNLMNLRNVTISGDGTSGIDKGFLFKDNPYRAVGMDGTIDKFTFQYAAFKNIQNLVISLPYEKAYTGAEGSFLQDIKFLHIDCDNTNQFLGTSGSVENGVITGLIKNIEIAYLDFRNSPSTGAVVYLGNAENYNVHNNRIDNINTAVNNHNGIFLLCGNGSFYDNYVSNHQGNAIRAHAFTVGTTPKDVNIYNNIVVNSRKYSGFEVQGFAINMKAGKTTYVNAKVFNNTCGNLNTSNDWVGGVVDVYTLQGGVCEVFNNLGYNFKDGSAIMNQQGDLVIKTYNNIYAKTAAAAGLVNESTFKLTSNAAAKLAGAATPFSIKDFYDAFRGAKPSIGAVE